MPWTFPGDRPLTRALLASLLLHVLAALAWQLPPPGRPAEATVLRAVLLPALQARPEEVRPPPVLVRRPDATARPARVERAAAPVSAASAGAAGGAQLAETPAHPTAERPYAPVAPLAVSQWETRPTGAGVAVASAISDEDPGFGTPAAAPAAAAVHLASAATVPGHAEAVFTAGAAGLAEAPGAAASAGGSPAARPPTLRPAGMGRPLAVTGEAGGNEFVEYADDNPAFVYPRQAARLGQQGTVLLEVEVWPDGRPGAIRIQRGSGHAQLDQDALRQMATWRFKPATRLGRPHAARVVVPIHYRLHDAP